MLRPRGRHIRARPHRRSPAFVAGGVFGLALFGVATASQSPPPSTPADAPAIDEVATTTTLPIDVAAPASAPPETLPPLRSFTMAFTGDVLIHAGVRSAASAHGAESGRAYDFRPIFDPIRPVLEGVDWAVCHLEVTLSADGTRLSGFPRFRAPGELASDLADVGYDACSTASNHSLDFGSDGVRETIEVLEAAGLRHTGTARSAEEEARTRWFEIGGTTVAHLSFSYGFNGYTVPSEAPWTVRPIDERLILEHAAQVRSEGAEFVVVSLHWGNEYQHDLSAQQADLGPRLIGSPDIDLVVGHHAHVVQPIERIDGEWIVYGLGNLVSNQTQPTRRDELLVIANVRERRDGTFGVADLTAVPLHLDSASMTVYPSGPALRPDGVSGSLAGQLDASFQRVRAVVENGAGYESLDLLG